MRQKLDLLGPAAVAEDLFSRREFDSIKSFLWIVLEKHLMRVAGDHGFGLSSNIQALDAATDGFCNSSLIAFSGRHAAARDLALHYAFMAAAEKASIAVLSPRRRHESITERLLGWLAGVALRDTEACQLEADDHTRIAWAAKFATMLPMYLVDLPGSITEMHEVVSRLKNDKGIEVVFIDKPAYYAASDASVIDPVLVHQLMQVVESDAPDGHFTVLIVAESETGRRATADRTAAGMRGVLSLSAMLSDRADFVLDVETVMAGTPPTRNVEVRVTGHSLSEQIVVTAPQLRFGRFGDEAYWEILRLLNER